MFSSKIKGSIATVAAIACVLGAAGPASASSARYVPTSIEVVGMDPETTGLKYETEITDYLQRRTDVLAVHAGGGWDPLGYQHPGGLRAPASG